MNKLLSTTVLSTAMIAGSAIAQIDANWSGNYTYGVSIVDTDAADTQSVQQGADWEIDFKGSFEMDNGITAYVDLEMDASGTEAVRTDDIQLGLRGSFGNVSFGKIDYTHSGAGYTPLPLVNAIDNKTGVDSAAFTRMGDANSDFDGILYQTPSLSLGSFNIGAGAGYHSGASGQTNNVRFTNDISETVSAGMSIDGSFGDTSVDFGFSHSLRLDNDEEKETNVGLSVGFGGFGITAAYEMYTNEDSEDTDTFGVSGSYSTGPWNLAAGYSVSDIEGATSAQDDEDSTIMATATYAMGPGVALGLQGFQTEEDLSGDSGHEIKLFTSINF